MAIHPTAIIDKTAEIDSTAEVGAYAVVDGSVRIGPGVRLYVHAFVTGWTELAEGCEVHPFAVVGHRPQDFHFTGERTYCRIGSGSVIREHAQVHRGSQPESATVIGARCQILAGSHIGHNCVLADEVTLINGAMLAGHVDVGRRAVLSGNVAIHQWVRVGELVMITAGGTMSMDFPPFMIGRNRNDCCAVNVVGLKRAEFPREHIEEIRRAYRVLYRSGRLFRDAVDELANTLTTPPGRRLVEFLLSPSKRGFCGSRSTPSTREERD